MTQQQRNELVEHLRAVQDYYTYEDAADEFGVAAPTLRAICKAYGVNLLSPSDQKLNYLRDMAPKKSIDEIARKLDCRVEYLINMADKAGIEFTREKEPVPEMPPIRPEELDGYYLLLADILAPMRKKRPGGFKDKYTQSGSPFGIADEDK